MEIPTKGSIVLIRFPFSDLTKLKLRPALVIAKTNKDDFILCQITSKEYGDFYTVKLLENDFKIGSLNKESYVRYTKLFTANNSIIISNLAKLKENKFDDIINSLIEYLRR